MEMPMRMTSKDEKMIRKLVVEIILACAKHGSNYRLNKIALERVLKGTYEDKYERNRNNIPMDEGENTKGKRE